MRAPFSPMLTNNSPPDGGDRMRQRLLPDAEERKDGSGRAARVVLLLLILGGGALLVGRTIAPLRAELEQIPVVGSQLFGETAWPTLRTTSVGTAVAPGAPNSPVEPSVVLRLLQEEVAAREAVLAVHEELQREQAARLRDEEELVRSAQSRLAEATQEAARLRQELQGQLATERERVAVVRSMRFTAQVQLFTAMTDEEAMRLLIHMEPEEIGRILDGMAPERATRLLHRFSGEPIPSG